MPAFTIRISIEDMSDSYVVQTYAKRKGWGENDHVHSTERIWNVTLGADNLTFKVGALGDFRKKKIFITSTGNSTTVSRVFRLWVNGN